MKQLSAVENVKTTINWLETIRKWSKYQTHAAFPRWRTTVTSRFGTPKPSRGTSSTDWQRDTPVCPTFFTLVRRGLINCWRNRASPTSLLPLGSVVLLGLRRFSKISVWIAWRKASPPPSHSTIQSERYRLRRRSVRTGSRPAPSRRSCSRSCEDTWDSATTPGPGVLNVRPVFVQPVFVQLFSSNPFRPILT